MPRPLRLEARRKAAFDKLVSEMKVEELAERDGGEDMNAALRKHQWGSVGEEALKSQSHWMFRHFLR